MPTTIITGRDLTIEIDSTDYSAQTSSVTVSLELDRQEAEVLTTTAYKTLRTTGELTVEMYQDWGASPSLCEALFTAAKTAPDTPLAFTFVANTGATMTGNCYPSYPEAGGAASDMLTVSVSMTIQDGDVDLA
jgi:hypothetical protein